MMTRKWLKTATARCYRCTPSQKERADGRHLTPKYNATNNSEELKMNNVTEIKPSKDREALANNSLWNPWLVADITRCIGQSNVSTSQTVQEEDFHYLEWSNSNHKTDVYLEIRDGIQNLIVNIDRFRGHNERLALVGIAATYNLTYGECDDG